MPKKLSQITSHVTDDVERQVRILAELSGKSASQYIAELIENHLEQKFREYEFMHRAFGSQNSDNSLRSEGSPE